MTTLLLALPAAALEAAELITDRPDQTESAATVPPGRVQIEAGWTFTREDEEGERVESLEGPGTLMRVGLGPRLELRLGWAGRLEQDAGPEGVTDGELGLKVVLAEENGRRPAVALLVATSVPVGDRGLTSDRYDPSLRLAASTTLSERLSFAANVGMEWGSEPVAAAAPGREIRETLSRGLYTAALGIGLGERLGAFVELFGEVPVDAPGGAVHSLDGGITLLARDNLQLDAFAGVGLSTEAPDLFAGLGVSLRLPR